MVDHMNRGRGDFDAEDFEQAVEEARERAVGPTAAYLIGMPLLPDYLENSILSHDPFQSLDVNGVGKLISMAVKLGRGVNGNLKIGICGEHGGDPASVEFCHQNGLDYVSCSPFRVPIARFAAAQAAIKYRD